jgi:phosphoglycolate phosphatase-like HAD superfamily hydrolase
VYSTEQLGKHVLWIGDTEADWKAGESLGCRVILLSNGLRNDEFLEALGGGLIMPSIASLKNNVFEAVDVY